jgi:hypothetical protein
MGHLQGRGSKVVSIQVSNDVKEQHIREKTQGNPTASAAGNRVNKSDRWRSHLFLLPTYSVDDIQTGDGIIACVPLLSRPERTPACFQPDMGTGIGWLEGASFDFHSDGA